MRNVEQNEYKQHICKLNYEEYIIHNVLKLKSQDSITNYQIFIFADFRCMPKYNNVVFYAIRRESIIRTGNGHKMG